MFARQEADIEKGISRIVRHQSLGNNPTVLASCLREVLRDKQLVLAMFEDPKLASLENYKADGPAVVAYIVHSTIR